MKVLRNIEIETEEFSVGDPLSINLDELGTFTATAQKVTEEGTLFLFDDCVAERPMNSKNSNKGGYDNSELSKWINTSLFEIFPEDIRSRIIYISLPTYGQILGHDKFYDEYIEPDDDEEFPLMKIRVNRIADYENSYEWYWLKNAIKKVVSSDAFAYVDDYGNALYTCASSSRGVRPVFLFK